MSVGIAFAEVKMDSGSGSLSSATHKQLGRFRTPLSESDNFGFRVNPLAFRPAFATNLAPDACNGSGDCKLRLVLEEIIGLINQFHYIRGCGCFFKGEGNEMAIVKSGEMCNVPGLYKAHCAHAFERPFSKSQKVPRCEHCQFDILWVLIKPELLENREISQSVITANAVQPLASNQRPRC